MHVRESMAKARYAPDCNEVKKKLAAIVAQEAAALSLLASQMSDEVSLFVDLVAECQGKVILSGMGKSGLVAQKIAATFSSLGIPSIFLHPVEALHGDLGVVQDRDLFVGISKSGKGAELEAIFQLISSCRTAFITCSSKIVLSAAQLIVYLPFVDEACYFKLAPTCSSTVTMAFGDAVAIVAGSKRGMGRDDYARVHPAGSLGQQLASGTVAQFMKTGDAIPRIRSNDSFSDAIAEVSKKKLGLVLVNDESNCLCGIITDGDVRRACLLGDAVFLKKAKDIMKKNPWTTAPDELALRALAFMEEHNITSLVVLEKKLVVGVLHMHDLIKAGLRS